MRPAVPVLETRGSDGTNLDVMAAASKLDTSPRSSGPGSTESRDEHDAMANETTMGNQTTLDTVDTMRSKKTSQSTTPRTPGPSRRDTKKTGLKAL